MPSLKDNVNTGLSEVRTTVLGVQILLGFQYQAVFQPAFDRLAAGAKLLEPIAFGLMLLSLTFVVSPITFHRLAERSDATLRECGWITLMITLSLLAFAVSLGFNVVMVTADDRGPALAIGIAVATAALSLFLWFGMTLMNRRPQKQRQGRTIEPVPLKEKVSEVLKESRIALPGVQALLGFQFAVYLTDAFRRLPANMRMVHTGSLVLLILAMTLMMTLAPFHRLADRGDATDRFDRLAVGLIVGGLASLACAVAGDFYIVVGTVTRSAATSLGAAAAALVMMLAIWFALPLALRRPAGSAPASPAA